MIAHIEKELQLQIDKDNFNPPEALSQAYYITTSTNSSIFFDIYFDTKDDTLFNNKALYRLRQRFKNQNIFASYLNDPLNTKSFPSRMEYQTKINRTHIDAGLSETEETRFEFRKESTPFNENNLPPNQPWDITTYITYLQRGKFKQYHLLPSQKLMAYLQKKDPNIQKIALSPSVAVITERERIHLNVPSPWGSGPNPEQAFIISLDTFRVYDGKKYLQFLSQRKPFAPKLLGTSQEIEIEFERNTSTKLDTLIQKQTDQYEKNTFIKNQFLQNQQEIQEHITQALKSIKIDIIPQNNSKYSQAHRFKK